MKDVLDACGLQPGEIFQLAAIPWPREAGRMEAKTFAEPRGAEAWARARSGKLNLYICGNPLRAHKDRKATNADVLEARVLLLDCDPDPDGDVLGACQMAKALVGGQLVDSGRGCQLWIPHDDEVVARRAAVLRALREAVADQFPGVKVDGTHDASRLMRLPRYPNLKTGKIARFVD